MKQLLEQVTDALAARLGTNSDEWTLVAEARKAVDRQAVQGVPVGWLVQSKSGGSFLTKQRPAVSVGDEWTWSAVYTAAPAPSVPEGWKMVPVEPTQEMCAAAVVFANGNAVYKNVAAEALRIEEGIYGEAYAAMLAASPEPPKC